MSLILLSACGGSSGGGSGSTAAKATSLASIIISHTSSVVIKQQLQFQYTATAIYTDGSTQLINSNMTWTSSNQNIATINNTGLVTASSTATGTTDITVSYQGISSKAATLNVTNATIKSITLSPSSTTLNKGAKQAYSATATYSDNSTSQINVGVTWNSSNPNVATIDSYGVATALTSSGTTNITATYQGLTSQNAILITTRSLLSFGKLI